MNGRYIVFEGGEGAGKSTVAAAVAAELSAQGISVVSVREPGGTELGDAIRQVLLAGPAVSAVAEVLLFAAQRAQLATEVIIPALDAGSWVLSDRSVYSSLAYQGHARGVGPELVGSLNEAALGGVWPDLVVLLRVSPEVGLAREQGTDRISGAGLEFACQVAAGFDSLAEDDPQRFVVVDVDGLSVEETVAAVVDRLIAASQPTYLQSV